MCLLGARLCHTDPQIDSETERVRIRSARRCWVCGGGATVVGAGFMTATGGEYLQPVERDGPPCSNLSFPLSSTRDRWLASDEL